MEKEKEAVKYQSEFNIALLFIPFFFVAIVLFFSLVYLVRSGYDNLLFVDLAIPITILLSAFAFIYFIYERVVLFEDKIEIYNIFNTLRVRIFFKDVKTIKYLHSQSSGDVWGPGRSYQSIVVVTKYSSYSFNSILLVNLRDLRAVLKSHVNLEKAQ